MQFISISQFPKIDNKAKRFQLCTFVCSKLKCGAEKKKNMWFSVPFILSIICARNWNKEISKINIKILRTRVHVMTLLDLVISASYVFYTSKNGTLNFHISSFWSLVLKCTSNSALYMIFFIYFLSLYKILLDLPYWRWQTSRSNFCPHL